MKYKYIILVFFLNFNVVYSQNGIPTEIRYKIEKNIIIGTILQDLDKSSLDVYEKYILDDGCHLSLRFFKLDLIFLTANLKDYDFYKIANDGNHTTCLGKDSKSYDIITISTGNQFKNYLSMVYLVAIDRENPRNIYYLSGLFPLSSFSFEFNLTANPDSYYEYLSLRLYSYDVENISYKKSKRRYIIFTAYSKALKKKIRIKINKKNKDLINIK